MPLGGKGGKDVKKKPSPFSFDVCGKKKEISGDRDGGGQMRREIGVGEGKREGISFRRQRGNVRNRAIQKEVFLVTNRSKEKNKNSRGGRKRKGKEKLD